MMYALLVDTENSFAAQNAPSAVDIERVIRAAMVNSGAELVGERARITRTGGLLANVASVTPQNATTVAWLVRANGPQTVEGLLPRWNRALGTLSADWTGARVVPVPTAGNDLLTWWLDQRAGASVTRSRDAFPTLTFDAPENPTGPTTSSDHSSTLSETVNNTVREVATTVTNTPAVKQTVNNAVDSAVTKAVVTVVVIAGLAYAGLKLYAPRPNPVRRPRARARR